MSLPLKDFRPGITESIHAALEAEAVSNDTTMEAVARRVLQDWADRKAHAYKVYARRVIANGMQTELPGLELEVTGSNRRGRRG